MGTDPEYESHQPSRTYFEVYNRSRKCYAFLRNAREAYCVKDK